MHCGAHRRCTQESKRRLRVDSSVLHKKHVKEQNTCSSAVACLVASSASKSCRKEVICAAQSRCHWDQRLCLLASLHSGSAEGQLQHKLAVGDKFQSNAAPAVAKLWLAVTTFLLCLSWSCFECLVAAGDVWVCFLCLLEQIVPAHVTHLTSCGLQSWAANS